MEREGEMTRPAPVLALFDVDGTLTPARKQADPDMLLFLQQLRKIVKVGILGGSDLVKISEQLGPNTTSDYDYVFAENGLVAFKDGKPLACQNLKLHMGDDQLKELINFILHYLADLDIPFKRGTFVEFRTGMINVSPVGRNCTREEREAFIEYDRIHRVRDKMVMVLKENFRHLNLSFPIGGEISFDVFPTGWDKTYCLQFLDKHFSEIHFFGDRTYKGGNDYEIYTSPRTIGHPVTCPEDTKKLCTELFLPSS